MLCWNLSCEKRIKQFGLKCQVNEFMSKSFLPFLGKRRKCPLKVKYSLPFLFLTLWSGLICEQSFFRFLVWSPLLAQAPDKSHKEEEDLSGCYHAATHSYFQPCSSLCAKQECVPLPGRSAWDLSYFCPISLFYVAHLFSFFFCIM